MVTYRKGDEELRIKQDEDPESPRDWGNLGTMVCFHKRYTLGDKKHGINQEEFSSWDELEDHLWKKKKAKIVLPLYLYDHSGISISISREYPFNCRWDSMQVGFIYATFEDLRKNFMKKSMNEELVKLAKKNLVAEVETYNQYLTGDVYGFTLVKLNKCGSCSQASEEIIESVWGFYGSDFKENGLFDHAGVKNIEDWEEVDD